MGWIRLDDGFLDHRKYLEAGPLAGYLNICAIAWSNRHRTDGRIPRSQVRRFVDFEGFAHHVWQGEIVGGGDDADALDLAEELVNVGLWERDGRNFLIHDYHDWQRSSDEIEAAIEQRRQAGKRGGRARWNSDSSNGSLNDSSSESLSGSSSEMLSEMPSRSKKEERTTTRDSPPGRARAREATNTNGSRTDNPSKDEVELADYIVGVLLRGIEGLTTDEQCRAPTRQAILAALREHRPTADDAKAIAIDVRSIAQSQNRAPNIARLYAQRLEQRASGSAVA